MKSIYSFTQWSNKFHCRSMNFSYLKVILFVPRTWYFSADALPQRSARIFLRAILQMILLSLASLQPSLCLCMCFCFFFSIPSLSYTCRCAGLIKSIIVFAVIPLKDLWAISGSCDQGFFMVLSWSNGFPMFQVLINKLLIAPLVSCSLMPDFLKGDG